MNPRILFLLHAILFTSAFSLEVDPKPDSNITVVGTVFCDACCNNSFSKHSYFLQGARVVVQCSFRANPLSTEEISIKVERITDKFGVYRVDIPPVDGFECEEGRVVESFCRATLISSSSSLCSVPGVASSTEHLAVKSSHPNLCVYNLNALSYRPASRDASLCGTSTESSSTNFNSSLFFWPPFLHWPFWPPFSFPFPFPSPPSFPFPFPSPPSLPFPFPSPPSFPFPFPSPPSLPFPFPSPPSFPFPFPSPPSFPFPLPPLLPTPSPPPFPFPFPPLFPTPSPPPFPFPFPPLFPPPSPPPFPFPFPPFPPTPPIFPAPPPPPPPFPFPFPPFPPLTPVPPLFAPPPPPPSPPPPSFPFPPLPPLFPAPTVPSPPPPPSFSLRDPRTWFPFHPPSNPNQPHNQHP